MKQKDEERVPEIELNKTCTIINVPVSSELEEKHLKILEYFTAVSFVRIVRQDDTGRYWEMYVIPGLIIPGSSLWAEIMIVFGNPKYFQQIV